MINEPTHVKLEIFIPKSHLAQLQAGLTAGGIGIVGKYDSCLSMVEVQGFWRPLAGASPFDGEVGELSTGTELKVEVRCPVEKISQALRIIRTAHPYEEPLINIVPLMNHLFE